MRERERERERAQKTVLRVTLQVPKVLKVWGFTYGANASIIGT